MMVLVFNNSIFALRSTDNWPIYHLLQLATGRFTSVILPQYMVSRQELYLYAVCWSYKPPVRKSTLGRFPLPLQWVCTIPLYVGSTTCRWLDLWVRWLPYVALTLVFAASRLVGVL